MSLKSKSSDVECSLRNNSFTGLRFFNSMSILITSKNFCFVCKIRISFPYIEYQQIGNSSMDKSKIENVVKKIK